MAEFMTKARSAFASIARPGWFGVETAVPGLTIAEIADCAIASLVARKGQAAAVVAMARRMLGHELPLMPRRITAGDLAFLWAGPSQWLVLSSGGDSDALAARLADMFAGIASVCAQGDGRGVLRLSGPQARAVLAKVLPLDLHERAFKPGDTALSVIGQMGVQISCLDAAPTFELVTARSFAGSLWRLLTQSAGEYGYVVEAPRLANPGATGAG